MKNGLSVLSLVLFVFLGATPTKVQAASPEEVILECPIEKWEKISVRKSPENRIRVIHDEYDRDRDGLGVYVVEQHVLMDTLNADSNQVNVVPGSTTYAYAFSGNHGPSSLEITLSPMGVSGDVQFGFGGQGHAFEHLKETFSKAVAPYIESSALVITCQRPIN